MKSSFVSVLHGFVIMATLGTATASEYLITGTTPWQRLENAPVITWVEHDRSWYQKGLTGVSQPYPKSLYFMDNQGNWYTPFIHRGMTPPYDLRGWHQ